MGNYLTLEQLKETLDIDDDGHYADDDIEDAIDAAEETIEGYMGDTRFYPTAETRYYTANCFDTEVAIDDLATLTSVHVDADGTGAYATVWVEGTDFYLDPVNATLNGQPKRRLVLRRQAGRVFPSYARGIKVVATFGWAEPPAAVRMSTKILASRLLKRCRETPYAVVSIVGADMVASARLGRLDPDVATMLENIPGVKKVLFV